MLLLTLGVVAHRGLKMEDKVSLLRMQRDMQAKRILETHQYKENIRCIIADIERDINNPELLENLQNRCQAYVKEFTTGDGVADALIAYKKNICSSKGISFKVNIIEKEEIHLAPEEYVGLLGNLLDNAIEAAEKSEERWIEANISAVKGQWMLRITNSKPETEVPLAKNMRTSKADKANHGIGLRVVDKIVKAHKGIITRKDEGNIFETLVAINNH